MKFTKRFISVLLCVLMLCSVTAISAGAKVTYESGNFVYEHINNGTEFEIDSYIGTVATDVTYRSYNSIPITSVGSNAYNSNTTLETLTFSSSLKYIQGYAFYNATALTTVNCKSALEYIGNFAFYGCSSLASINLEDTVITAVNQSSFMGCKSLTEVTLPETVETIGINAFASCDSLSKITIPASVTEISDNAFSDSDNVVIYCYTDSTAHTYAEANAIEYVLIDAPKETYILGNVDGDEIVSILDATRIQLLLAQLTEEPMTDGELLCGDIDGDGVLSIMDATFIQLYLVGLEENYPIGETFEI